MKQKILIIRFSSFGDIVQCLAVVSALKKRFPGSEIHWATKKEFAQVVSLHSDVHKIWTLNKKDGPWQLTRALMREKFDFVYDAHKSLRSFFMRLLLVPPWKRLEGALIVRPKYRWKRFLLFQLRMDTFPMPFRGMKSYLAPLLKWEVEQNPPSGEGLVFPPESQVATQFQRSIVLVPSAAWEMKRWPLAHWKKLVEQLPHEKFIILGGPEDVFCEEIYAMAKDRIINLAGKLNLLQSCAVLRDAKMVISADTGLLHMADLLGVKALALIGPTAFGFPTGNNVTTLEVSLPCRPCTKDGRGTCSQSVYQKCMVDISPETVVRAIFTTLGA